MKCINCKSEFLIKFGKQNNIQRYKCNSCKKVFQLHYKYNACKPNTAENIKKLNKRRYGH